MITSLPLKNKHIMVPRGKREAKSFSELVIKYGGIPVEIPLIAFKPVGLNETLKEKLNELHTYDWIIFTSNVTVDTFFSFIEAGRGLPKVAVIGERTKQMLLRKGVDVHFTPSKYVAEEFVEEFLPLISEGEKVLIPKGNLAREYIATSLMKKGATVDEIIIYETYLPEESRLKLIESLREDKLDILTFTSPSTIDHFMDTVKMYALEDKLQRCIVACIGPVSKERAESHGLTVHVMPETYTVEDMLKDLIEYLHS